MYPKLNILITSGGTDVPIDAVRTLSNKSKGTTGALIAEELLERGHKVTFIYSRNSITPFFKTLSLQSIQKNSLSIINKKLDHIKSLLLNLTLIEVTDFYHYQKELEDKVRHHDVAILSMAASDYKPVSFQDSKSSISQISFELLPKLISNVKNINPKIFLVGFKLCKDSTNIELIDIAYESLLKNKCSLVVANKVDSNFKPVSTYIINAEKGVHVINKREDLSVQLSNLIEKRYSQSFYKTIIKENSNTPPKKLTKLLHTCNSLGLFPNYLPNNPAQFGFLAYRSSNGFFITPRGSEKTSFSFVHEIDKNIIYTDTKASLNAPLADIIFKKRPDINYILHLHFQLPGAITVNSFQPGTIEDTKSIVPVINYNSFNQKNHGCFLLFNKSNQLFSILEKFNCYNTSGKNYDLLYSRFLSNDSISSFISQNFHNKNMHILDYCAGTGENAKLISDQGFNNIFLHDCSNSMLSHALSKYNFPLDLQLSNFYDLITIRQAINYFSDEQLIELFSKFYNLLNPNGSIVFNTFVPFFEPKHRSTVYDNAVYSEHSILLKNKIYHTQSARILNDNCHDLIDFNWFFQRDLNFFTMFIAYYFPNKFFIRQKVNKSSILYHIIKK